MNLKSSFLYARKIVFPKKSLRSRGNKSLFGAMICIGISLIPLVAILTVSDGMVEGITSRMIQLSSHDLTVSLENGTEETESLTDFINASMKFKSFEKITEVYPEISCSALAAGQSYRSGAYVRAVEEDVFKRNKGFSEYFTFSEGTADFSSGQNAVIGQRLSEILNVHAGDSIKLITVNTKGKKSIPKVSVFKVTGIVSCGYQELDALWIFIPLKSAFKALALSSAEFNIGLATDCTFKTSELMKLQRNLQEFLYSFDGIDNAYVLRWDEVNRSQFENFSSTKALLLLIVIIIVLVASINICSAIVMLVMERKKEIAILKSTGASSGGITASFLFAGLFCGCGGILFGIPAGLLISVNINSLISLVEKIGNSFIKVSGVLRYGKSYSSDKLIKILNPEYYLQNIPVSIPVKELILITVFTLILSVVMAAIPAINAGREKPIATLRKM